MALQMTVSTESGIQVSDAYIRIESLTGNKQSLSLQVYAYVDQNKADTGKPPVHRWTYAFQPSVDPGADNFIKQGYVHLKSLDVFAAAADILEGEVTG